MQGVSRDSLATARERLDAVAADSTVDMLALSDELFEVIRVLDRETSLRRALSDPAASGERKAGLVRALLGDRLGGATLNLAAEVVAQRWSRPRDVADALEILAVSAAVVSAEREGRLDDLEDELFRFGRIADAQPELRTALGNPALPVERKHELIQALLADRVTAATLRLVEQVAIGPRGRSLDRALESYARLAAERRERLIAHVQVAVPLTDEQKRRLAEGLAARYGAGIHLNVEVVPDVVGGVRVRIGDEVIEGSVAARLERARRHLAG